MLGFITITDPITEEDAHNIREQMRLVSEGVIKRKTEIRDIYSSEGSPYEIIKDPT